MGKERVMADYCACTELEPLLDEIRQRFAEAGERHERLSLTLANQGRTYRYTLESKVRSQPREVQEVAGKALEMLRGGSGALAPLN